MPQAGRVSEHFPPRLAWCLPTLLPAQIAVEGCGHGELDKIYETMAALERRDGRKIDLLICCGDFQVGPGRVAGMAERCSRLAVLQAARAGVAHLLGSMAGTLGALACQLS